MWDDSNNAPTRSVGVWCFAVKFMLTFHQLQLLWPLLVAQLLLNAHCTIYFEASTLPEETISALGGYILSEKATERHLLSRCRVAY